jgi:hypothetical protein
LDGQGDIFWMSKSELWWSSWYLDGQAGICATKLIFGQPKMLFGWSSWYMDGLAGIRMTMPIFGWVQVDIRMARLIFSWPSKYVDGSTGIFGQADILMTTSTFSWPSLYSDVRAGIRMTWERWYYLAKPIFRWPNKYLDAMLSFGWSRHYGHDQTNNSKVKLTFGW